MPGTDSTITLVTGACGFVRLKISAGAIGQAWWMPPLLMIFAIMG
ncbi:MAG: hypothetical protein P8M26_01385 [Gammaproteobacteria bacterium]|nr:hypothetical protein [Gammaproteobacteria bacterium]